MKFLRLIALSSILVAALVAQEDVGLIGATGATGSISPLLYGEVSVAQVGPQEVHKILEIPGHFYLVDFTFDSSWSTVPLTNPPGVPHYLATAVAFEIIGGLRKQIGGSFPATFTDGKCFEDNLPDLVERQLESVGFVPTETTAAFKKYRDDEAYAKMQPFALEGHILNVTRKGVAEQINEITVDGVVVWSNPKPIKDGVLYLNGTGTLTIGDGTTVSGGSSVIVKQ